MTSLVFEQPHPNQMQILAAVLIGIAITQIILNHSHVLCLIKIIQTTIVFIIFSCNHPNNNRVYYINSNHPKIEYIFIRYSQRLTRSKDQVHLTVALPEHLKLLITVNNL